jgi:hypothetical protein
MKSAKLGLITTGQGPRNEYVRYHRNLMWELGIDVCIKICNAMDGLTRQEIRTMESLPRERQIGHHIHEEGATRDRLGTGWTRILTDSKPLIPLFQKCLESLEAQGVDLTILCCVEEFPIDSFQSRKPFLMPWVVVTEWVRITTMCMTEPRIGLLILDEEHRAQDMATWSSQPWMESLDLVVEIAGGRLDTALARCREEQVDMVVYWGYGLGLAPSDPPDKLQSVYETLGPIPLIAPNRLVAFHARNQLWPSLNDRRFVGYVFNQPGLPSEA